MECSILPPAMMISDDEWELVMSAGTDYPWIDAPRPEVEAWYSRWRSQHGDHFTANLLRAQVTHFRNQRKRRQMELRWAAQWTKPPPEKEKLPDGSFNIPTQDSWYFADGCIVTEVFTSLAEQGIDENSIDETVSTVTYEAEVLIRFDAVNEKADAREIVAARIEYLENNDTKLHQLTERLAFIRCLRATIFDETD